MRTFAKPACPLCQTRGEVLYSGLRDRLFAVPGDWQLRRCPAEDCGLLWSDPAPLADDIGLAYRRYYTHAEPARGARNPFLRAVRWAYWRATRIPALLTGLYRERQAFLQMFLGDLPPGRLLDVGCGDGEFLALMTQHGWHGEGVDFDAAAVDAGRRKYGLTLEAGDFQAADFAESAFDAVTMSHLLEHVPDPLACLEKARRLLRPGGRLVVTTPNPRSLGHRRFQSAWRGLEPPRHLYLFTPRLLGECARRTGLHVLRTGSTAVNADYVANASMAIERAPAGAVGGIGGGWTMRYALAAVVFQYREHFALRHDPDVGEEAFLVAERPA